MEKRSYTHKSLETGISCDIFCSAAFSSAVRWASCMRLPVFPTVPRAFGVGMIGGRACGPDPRHPAAQAQGSAMTQASGEANAPLGNSRFEAIASSALSGASSAFPFSALPSAPPCSSTSGPTCSARSPFPLRPLAQRHRAPCRGPVSVRSAHPAHGRLRAHGHPH